MSLHSRFFGGNTAASGASSAISVKQNLVAVLLLLLSSALLCIVCLSFAIGVYDWNIFLGYFRHPLIILLNWIPILICQGLLLCLTNRKWLSFLVTAFIFLSASIGDFFKLKFRDEPFVFQDIGSIRAGLSVAGNYGVSLNKRILLAVLFVLVFSVLLFVSADGHMGKKPRICFAAVLLFSVVPLWRHVYSSEELYLKTANDNLILETWDSNQYYVANGFPYPFLHSITASRDLPPQGYSKVHALELLSQYEGGQIPDSKKVNLLVLQLESFTDLQEKGVLHISDDTYDILRSLQQESICGTLIANVIGGGTVDTECCFLSGSYGLQSYHKNSASYVRYLNAQGYSTSFGHPNRAFFYNRQNIAAYLGFGEAFFNDNRYAEISKSGWRCDSAFLPDVFEQFRTRVLDDEPVFDFRVSIQGHAPYNNASLDGDGHYWHGADSSEAGYFEVNNYLDMLVETQHLVSEGIDSLRDLARPCVVMIYGDHNPYFTSPAAYEALGLDFDMSTEKGLLNYYGTPWLIWANPAAKELLGNSFCGTGPTVSPGYLMNVLFQQLGWKGNAFMQFTNSVMDRLPVVSTNGYYIENDHFTNSPSEAGLQLLDAYECAQYYYRTEPEESTR